MGVQNERYLIKELEKQLELAKCDSRDLYFAQLLGGGHFHSEEQLRQAGQAVGLEFRYKHFLVLAAKLETWGMLFSEGQMDFKDINFILRNVLEHEFPGEGNAAEVQGRMVAILNLEDEPENGMKSIIQNARHALEVLESEFQLTVTVAISRVYDDPMELTAAMEDTNRIFEYLQLMGEDQPVTAYEELTHLHLHKSTTSFMDLETRLLGCIRTIDFSGVRMVLHELINNEFGETKPTVDTFRFRIYGVVNTLLYLMNDIEDVVGPAVIREIDPGPRLTSARTLEEIVTAMDDILGQLEQHTQKKQKSSILSWAEKAHTLVEEHFSDPNLNVAYVADQFDLTPTYCSKVFWEQYNIRLFDFIQLKRLEMAKVLMETSKSLKEIAQESGFGSALTMSRAFKRYEGTTPNHIRERIRNAEQTEGTT